MARFLSPREDGMTFRVPNGSNDGQILATDPHLEVHVRPAHFPGLRLAASATYNGQCGCFSGMQNNTTKNDNYNTYNNTN